MCATRNKPPVEVRSRGNEHCRSPDGGGPRKVRYTCKPTNVQNGYKLERKTLFDKLTEYDSVFESNESVSDVIEIERIIARDKVLQHETDVDAFLERELERVVGARFRGSWRWRCRG